MSIGVPSMLNCKEIFLIKTFALDNYKNEKIFTKNPISPNRQYVNLLQKNTTISDLSKKVWSRVFAELGFDPILEEPLFGIFLGVITEGGSVHTHTDPGQTIDGVFFEHVRINFLLSKPYCGGMPVVNNNEIIVQENEGWFNLASKWNHGCTTVKGNKPRICLSLGALVPDYDNNLSKYNLY